jgi:hypothetical protein
MPGYGQLPVVPIDIAAPPGHANVHVEPPEQFSEQLPSHVMWQVAPLEQSTLALAPTVIVHIEDPVHLRLHDAPHEPLQSFMFEQSSEQLVPHDELEMSQLCPDGHAHVVPVHFGGLPLLPHAAIQTSPSKTYFIEPLYDHAPPRDAGCVTYERCTLRVSPCRGPRRAADARRLSRRRPTRRPMP